jgi:iron(III) transport system permease protein
VSETAQFETPMAPLPQPEAPHAAAPSVALGRGRRPGALTWVALAVAGLFLLPIASVLVNLFLPSEGTWQHLSQTVLPGYLVNTALLALGVGIGVPVIGAGTAWLVTLCHFPGQRVFEWALILPLAVPAYVMAYSYTDVLQFTGPVQSLLREMTGWQAGDYWFPEIRSLGGATAMLILVLYPYAYVLSRAAPPGRASSGWPCRWPARRSPPVRRSP